MPQDDGDELARALDNACLLIKLRERSEREIRDRLRQKGYSAETIALVITGLYEMRLLDDRRFAEMFAESRLSFRGEGEYRIRRELAQKGVKEEIVDSVMEELFTRYEPLSVAVKALTDRFSGKADLDFKKCCDYLVRRGHSFSIAREAVTAFFEDTLEVKSDGTEFSG